MRFENLPEGWEVKELRDVCEIIAGQAPPSRYYNKERKGKPFLKVTSFGEKYPAVNTWTTKSLKNAKASDILLSVAGTIGEVNLSIDASITRSIFALRPIRSKVLQMYLYYFLKTKKDYFIRYERGSSQKIITKNDVYNLQILLPPISIQHKIVKLLETVEEAKKKRAEADKVTNKILESAFIEMFLKEKFQLEYIKNLVKKTETRDPRRTPTEEFFYVDIAGIDNKVGKIIDVKKIIGKKAPSRARRVIKKGDILISTVRPNLNATALVPEEFDNQICSTGFCVLQVNSKLNNKFLYVYTRMNMFINQLISRSKGASYPAVINSDVLNATIPLPPVKLQQKFANLVEQVENLKEKQQKSKEQIDALFDALMHKAFGGELVG